MLRKLLAGLIIGVGACSTTPPAPPVPRSAVPVNASFGRTWDAVIGLFADRNIPIKTVDRSSGLIVAEAQAISASAWSDSLADCGATTLGAHYRATAASWNVLVRGDSTRSTVKATVRFVAGNPSFPSANAGVECSSRGNWELALEQRVKSAAEEKR